MNEILNISGVECYEKDGTAYLKLETVARGLGFTQEKNGNEYVKWERVNDYLQSLNSPLVGKDGFIPENIFYRLAMKAKNETAEKFQALVADEIIPSIRKTGLYVAPSVDSAFLRKVADEMEAKEKQIAQLSAENERQRQAIEDFEPQRKYLDTILASTDTMATTQIAADYALSARALNKILHEEGVQHKINGQWILYRKYMGKGYTRSNTIQFLHSDGRPDTRMVTVWTQKGRLLIHTILEKRGIVAAMDKE